jgi:hypothetical protein
VANSSVRILHLVPQSFLSEKHRYLGSTKDIAARVQYFEDRDLNFDLVAHDKTLETVFDALGAVDLSIYTHLLIEKANYGELFRRLRKEAPAAKIIFRAHNAEMLHRVDYVRACLASPRSRGLSEVAQHVRNIGVYGARDLSVVRHADHVLGINEWDTTHYWRYLAPKARVTTAPFFLPRQYLEEARPSPRKKKLCIVLGSSQPGPLIEHGINEFFRLLSQTGAAPYDSAGWRFIISGARTSRMPKAAELKALGVKRRNVESPYELFGPAQATLIASDLGRGFKTKILEAIACEAFVICNPGLYRRLPSELLPYCIRFDPRSPEAFLDALGRTENGFSQGNPNELLRATAYRQMDRVLGLVTTESQSVTEPRSTLGEAQ